MLQLCVLLVCVVAARGAALGDAHCMSSVDYASVPIVEKELYQPPLDEVVQVLSNALRQNFEHVEVSVVECPDLTKPPYYLTASGLSGNPKLVEVGGVPYLLPLVNRDKVYDLKGLVEHLRRGDSAYVAGAGAGPWPYAGVNCEGIVNLMVKNGTVSQGSRIVTVEPRGAAKGSSGYLQRQLPDTETRSALLGNYLVTDGNPGKVIKVEVKGRTGADNYITAIREGLKKYYKDKVVGLGGMFLLKNGSVKFHVMPEFSTKPLCSDSDVDEWLHYFEMSAPITVLGTLVTGDMGLDLRVQHFHGFSAHGDGGHYHYDTSPARAHYEGYFVLGAALVRVDAPTDTHDFGRD
ncbi:hypothetical protein O3G_MSEX010192 [Manduca sexta]|uniref:DUF1907 domain-containing protein n=1 Tax=Manduca sexta TaxID=7130 RepID=A0A921ZGW0_MANSE|nr:hypothetical protein O3G_MSEX010192 [Manduca sexta]